MHYPTSLLIWAIALLFPAYWVSAIDHTPFFWDTVQLASKHAHFFYENGLQWSALPSNIDSGHPPLLGYYLALCWSVFGKSLWVSHWAIYPFLVGLVFQTVKIGQYVAGAWGWFLLPMLWLDAVTAGQSVLVSPDIILLFGLLLAINGALYKQRIYSILGGILICAISMRGMMCAAALAFWLFFIANGSILQKAKAVWPMLPGAVVGLIFLIWHYKATGWVGHFEGSTWSAAFQRVDGKGLLRNVVILAWRWLDLNRFLVWFLVVFLFFRIGKRNFWSHNRSIFILFLCLAFFLTPSALIYQNLSAHRYFLPIFAVLHVLALTTIVQCNISDIKKTILLTALVIAIAAGNFWVYPRGVSMDWDSTLAHLPYHNLRAKAMNYIKEQHIDLQTVGTSFPNLNTGEHLLLNGDSRLMSAIDFQKNQWVLASNVLNDIDEPEYAELAAHWHLVRRWEQGMVWFELYQKGVKQ